MTRGWPLERVLFAIAGTMVGASVVLTVVVSIPFLAAAGSVAANPWLYVVVSACPASLVLRHAGVDPRRRS